jgi:hypothetical protein
MDLVGGRKAAGEFDVAGAVITGIAGAEIVEHQLVIWVVALPGGEVGEFLSPIDVGIAEEFCAAASATRSEVEERDVVGEGGEGFGG